jgi:hypothetical protein
MTYSVGAHGTPGNQVLRDGQHYNWPVLTRTRKNWIKCFRFQPEQGPITAGRVRKERVELGGEK